MRHERRTERGEAPRGGWCPGDGPKGGQGRGGTGKWGFQQSVFLPPQVPVPFCREPQLRDPLVFPQLEEGVSSCPSPGIQAPPSFLDCTGTLQGQEGNVGTLNWSQMEPSHGGTARSCRGWRLRTWLGCSGALFLGYGAKG